MTPACAPERFLRLAEVRSITGLSTAGVYAAQADMEFPREIRLGQSAQVWMNSDVQKWIEERGGS
jgi:prophage regulatory protein